MGDEFLKKIEQRVAEADLPDIKFSRRTMRVELREREFLVLSADALQGFQVFIGTEDSGGYLEITWYLLHNDLVAPRSFDTENITTAKAWFDEFYDSTDRHSMKNWLKIVNDIILDEVKQMVDGLNLDFSKVDVHTRGFLNLP